MTDPNNRAKWYTLSREHFRKVAQKYDGGRALKQLQGDFWAQEIAANVTLSSQARLLDVGCGTGLLTLPIAQALPCWVYGVEPSAAMLSQARAHPESARVRWVQGQAEQIAFSSESVGAIFISQVWHHLDDGLAVAREFYRLLQPGGVLFIKTFSHAQLRTRWDITKVFPTLLAFMLDIYPDISQFESILHQAGFPQVDNRSYQKDAALRPSELLRIAEDKAWSMFSYLSEEEYQRGKTLLRQQITETNDAPVAYPEFHLLVIARK